MSTPNKNLVFIDVDATRGSTDHPSPVAFPLGENESGEVFWDTRNDDHLIAVGKSSEGMDALLDKVLFQAYNHDRRWSIYSANAFGAGKHAHGLPPTAWHRPANIGLYSLMTTELEKLCYERKENREKYNGPHIAITRWKLWTNDIIVLLPALSTLMADKSQEAQAVRDQIQIIAEIGPAVDVHCVFAFDSEEGAELVSSISSSSVAVKLRG